MQIAEVLQCRRDSANKAAFFHRLFHSSVENLPLKVENCTQFRSSDCSPKMNIHARLKVIDERAILPQERCILLLRAFPQATFLMPLPHAIEEK